MDEELREVMIMADSLLSLVAYRFPRGNIPEDVLHDMKVTANRLREFYDSRSNRTQE